MDRMLPTLPLRGERAIAGDSMGGYGAMHIALGHPYRFGGESWLGFFNGLEGELRADRPLLRRAGLHAFLYGGEDDIADPSETRLRRRPASGRRRRQNAVYPGEHNLDTVDAHLSSQLVFAGRALRQPPSRARHDR